MSDAKLDKNHEHSSGMQESIEAEGTEERVFALHTEMCEKSGDTSVEEGHDVESDVAEETMSAMVKPVKAICEPYDVGQPTAECQFRGLPGESWFHDEASSCPCRAEQKRVSSDGGRYASQTGEIVGILKQLKGEFEKEELDRKTKHQDLMKAETKEIFVLTKANGEKETEALKLEHSAKEVAQRPPPWRDKFRAC